MLNGRLLRYVRTTTFFFQPNVCLASTLHQQPSSPVFYTSSFSSCFTFSASDLHPVALSLFLFQSLSPSVYPLTLTFPCPHLPLSVSVSFSFPFSLSLSLHPIHAPFTRSLQSEKDNSLVLCREMGSKNREGYLSCSLFKGMFEISPR